MLTLSSLAAFVPMMPLHTWLAFAAACGVVLVIPGPTVMLVVGYSLSRGARAAWWTAFGVALGDTTAMTCSLLGLGAFLTTSAALFSALKWGGALYLIYLGIKMWRAAPVFAAPGDAQACAPAPSGSRLRMIGHAWLVTALNPKSILFFVAFVPQFIAPDLPAAPQMLACLATFVPLAFVNAAGYAFLAGGIRRAASRPYLLRAVNRLGGATLVSAGVWTALRRS